MARKKVQIPKDESSNSRFNDRDCWAKFYGRTEKEVRAKGDALIKKVPYVYTPHYSVPPTRHKDGYWWCQVTMRNTCD